MIWRGNVHLCQHIQMKILQSFQGVRILEIAECGARLPGGRDGRGGGAAFVNPSRPIESYPRSVSQRTHWTGFWAGPSFGISQQNTHQ